MHVSDRLYFSEVNAVKFTATLVNKSNYKITVLLLYRRHGSYLGNFVNRLYNIIVSSWNWLAQIITDDHHKLHNIKFKL